MKNKYLRFKILCGMLCTGLALSGASISFAATQDNGSSNMKLTSSTDIRVPIDKAKQAMHVEMNSTLESVIKESVASNIITQTEGDKVLEYVKSKSHKKFEENTKDKKCKDGKCEGARGGLFTGLVVDGVLSKEKSDALKEKMYIKSAELRIEKIKVGLNTLVTNKVLTAEQSVKVKEAIMARDCERKENFKKMKDMNESEIKHYMKKIKSSKVSPMKVLLDNGTITKDQEKEIQKILPHYKHGGKGFKHK